MLPYRQINCKYCGSHLAVLNYRAYKGTRRYWCKICKRKFKDDSALFRMRVPSSYVIVALSLRTLGYPIKDIVNYFRKEYGHCPSTQSVWNWCRKAIDFDDVIVPNGCQYYPSCFDCPESDCIL